MKNFGQIYYLQLEFDKSKLTMEMNYKAELLGV